MSRRDYEERVLRVLVYIQDRLDEEMLLDELASVACFSPFHFHRIFRGQVGESVQQYIRRLRLERAAYRLKHSGRSVVDIAFEAGYGAHESFSRAFRSAFGCAPSSFRNENRSSRLPSRVDVHYGALCSTEALRAGQEENAMDVEVRDVERMRVAFLRHIGPYDQVGETWERLMDWAGRECLFGPNTNYFGRCWDDPEVTSPERVRYDACVTVGPEVEPVGEIGIDRVGGGLYAVALHEGPYDQMKQTYADLLGRWFPHRGMTPGAPPSLEFYLNDPESTEPEDLLTEVHMPIE